MIVYNAVGIVIIINRIVTTLFIPSVERWLLRIKLLERLSHDSFHFTVRLNQNCVK